MLWGSAKSSAWTGVGSGNLPTLTWLWGKFGVLVCCSFFCWLPVAIFGQTCVREAMHGVGVGVGIGVGVGGASVKFSCATVDILLVFSYARNPETVREREGTS